MLGFIILFLALVASFWPTDLLPHNPFQGVQGARFIPPAFAGGAPEHLLGTEALGKDIASMLVAGARYTLIVAGVASAISVAIGVPLGIIAGYYRGKIDSFFMRLVDVQLAFPEMILLIAVIAIFGPGLWNIVFILGIAGWAPYARLTRGAVLSLRERGFVEAAKSMGLGNLYIMGKHILPNVMSSVVVFLSSDLARLVLLESALSFLGLGVQPPTPSWGAMIADGRQYMSAAPWASALPGIAIVLTVLAFNFVGDAVRDILDPRSQRDSLGTKARKMVFRR